jgi:hypothetical protein
VAVFKLVSANGTVLDWFSPSKFLYEALFTERDDMDVSGDHSQFRDYHVHYIGQAFKNDVWKRLTGHEKMQSILTNEDALNTQSLRAPFEISILLLDVDGYTEAAMMPPSAIAIRPGHTPIIHKFSLAEDDGTFEKFANMTLATRAQELTNEVEAMLVKQFDPQYNILKYRNYPNIKKGTRSAGYTQSELMIERMPALLKSRKHRMLPIGGSKTRRSRGQ